MDFSDIASISGKPGLYKIVKPTRTGVIVESMDEKKSRFMAGISHRVSVLNEISIYTTDGEGYEPLEEVMKKIYADFEDDPGIDASASGAELRAFLKHVLPNYDEDRVYTSDIKKLVSWYHILVAFQPELLQDKKKKKKEPSKSSRQTSGKKESKKAGETTEKEKSSKTDQNKSEK